MIIEKTIVIAGLIGACIGYIFGKSDENNRLQKLMWAKKMKREQFERSRKQQAEREQQMKGGKNG